MQNLKKIVFTIITFLAIPVFSLAQNNLENAENIKDNESIFQPILVAGFNATQVDGDDLQGYRNIGANIGGGVDILLPKNFAIGFELLYSMKGARSSVNQSVRIADVKIAMDYIDIPILGKYIVDDRLIFHLGVIANTLVRYKETWNNIEQDFPTNRFALEVAGGATFMIVDWFGINARMSYSLTNTLANPVTVPSGRFNRKRSHNVLTLRAIFHLQNFSSKK